MRSRALQPRSLFRIGGAAGPAARPSVFALPSACSSSLQAAAAASTSTASASAAAASSSSSSASAAALVPHARCASTSASSSQPAAPGTSSRQRHRTRSGSVRKARQAQSTSSSDDRKAAATTSSGPRRFASPLRLPSHPVVPVRPPPHSKVSLGLQSFFSQGRPLLEHNNLLDPAATLSAISGSAVPADAFSRGGSHNAALPAAAMVVVLPNGGQPHTTSPDPAPVESKEQPHDEVAAAGSALERLGISDAIRQSIQSVVEGQAIDAKGIAHLEGILSRLRPEAAAGHVDMGPSEQLSVSLHLPPLNSISKSTFDRLIDSAAAPRSPLALHADIAAEQAWEAERTRAVEAAKERGEDTLLAQRLGPESDLVVLGEPEGPKAEWGRGVASYLARYGRPFEAPSHPCERGTEAAKVKTLQDLMSYHVSDLSEDFFDDASDLSASSASASTADDVHLWLGHALVQDKAKADIEWTSALEKTLGKEAAEGVLGAKVDVSSLKAFGHGNEPQSGVQTVAVTPSQRRGGGGSFVVDGEAPSPLDVQMDSTHRKRRKKMNKMKYKKLRKRQRAERQRLKK
ncbi:unnamed protein product [Parajaminaea phylloscopi]